MVQLFDFFAPRLPINRGDDLAKAKSAWRLVILI
jgi:hypothetical protein